MHDKIAHSSSEIQKHQIASNWAPISTAVARLKALSVWLVWLQLLIRSYKSTASCMNIYTVYGAHAWSVNGLCMCGGIELVFCLGFLGVVDRSLQRPSSCGSAAKNATYTGHACEKLHRVIAKEKRKLDVKISRVPLWVRYSRKRLAPAFVHYPVLRMPDWVETIFKNGGHFFLGGRSMDMWPQVQNELLHFWSAYKKIDSDFPLYKDMPERKLGSCIPVAIHGDEGRGRLHNPVMVVALQTLLPLVGKKTNMQGYLAYRTAIFYLRRTGRSLVFFQGRMGQLLVSVLRSSLCTRLLYTCLPAPYSHKSFHTLLSVLAEDLNKMWKDGVDVPR